MSMNRDTDLLLQSGIAAVRSGDKREGARLLAQVVRKEPQSEDAWFWLAAATDQPAEAAACLRRVLAINPNNARARQALNMLDTGQGQAAFSTGPLETETNGDSGNRPLSTGDLISPYSPPTQPVAPPVSAPPPPPFGNDDPYGNEQTVQSALPFGSNPYGGEPTVNAAPPPFAWNTNPQGEMPADPYSVNTIPSAQPVQSNLPPPPTFIGGGGVRLGQLDPNAPMVQINPNMAGPVVSDPGAELRASLLPPTPYNAVPPPPGQVIVVKKRRRLNPLLMVLAVVIVLLLAALIAFLLLQNKATPNPVADVPANQTATAAVALAATSTAQGTPALTGAANGTPGVGSGTAGAGNGTAGTGANGTPGVGGTGAANGTPGVGNGTPGVGVGNGTPGTGVGNGTPGVNGTVGTGTLPAGTVQPGQPTPTAQGAGQPGNTTVTGTNPGSTATAGSGTGTTAGTGSELPGNATPTVVSGLSTDVPPPTVRDNRPPPEVIDYVNNTAKYINNAQFFEAAIAEGIVKPYRAGRIKPGVTMINVPQLRLPGSSISQIVPSSVFSSTTSTGNGASTVSATTTPNPTSLASGTPGVTGGANGGTPGTPSTGTPGASTTPQATGTAAVTGGPSSTPLSTENIPPEAQQVVVNGPAGPQVYYLINFSGASDMNRMTLALGRVARVLKDQPTPAGAYELNQVSLEYANDLSNMANSMDMFFQSGKISYLDDLANYYDKAVRDRGRWATIVTNGYPFHIIL